MSQPYCFSIRVSGNPTKKNSAVSNPQKFLLDLMQLLQKWSELSNLYKKLESKATLTFYQSRVYGNPYKSEVGTGATLSIFSKSASEQPYN